MKHINIPTKPLFVLALALSLLPQVSGPMALIGGFLFTHFLGNPYQQRVGQLTSLLLKGSVVGLGFGMNLHSAIEVGRDGLLLTLFSITTVLTLGAYVGHLLKLPRRISHLTASGTAICGGSAIAAVAPAVEAKPKEVSVALGVVFFLNSIALILFPILGHLLSLDQHQFGMWCAIAIHDTSSVVGAASAYGEEALMVATTVKLARALWIIPISILSTILFRAKSRKVSIPWFIALFVIAMVANSYIPQIHDLGHTLFDISKSLLVVTLFLIGSSLSVESIKEVGAKPLILGVILWVTISILSLAVILIQ